MKKIVLIIISVVLLGALYFFATNTYKDSKSKEAANIAKENANIFIREYSPTIGKADAKVSIVEFFDPECETCRVFHGFVKNILDEYPDDVKLTLRYAPFHKNSKGIVRILEAARLQGKYWQTLDLLYYYQPQWGNHHNPRPELVWDYLPQIEGLDIEKLKADMHSEKITKIIEQDIADLEKLQVRKTPTFFVNERPLPSFGYKQLLNLIEEELAK